jgi:glycosyltransferase involved in cell wall biosynthesis
MNFDIRHDEPIASVVVITYNHEPYIRECLDSLLMQETDFPYEICVGEDESNDGTREICVEYAGRRPDRIRLILRSQTDPGRSNYAAQGNYNFVQTSLFCRGKYLATCEGDDAWTDPKKLQKQVDVMEADSSIALVHSDYDKLNLVAGTRINSVHRTRGIQHIVDPDPNRFVFDLIQLHYPIATCTVLARADAVRDIYAKHLDLFYKLPMGDIPKWCELTRYGSFHYMDEPLALYRVLQESASNTQSPARKFRFVNKASDLGLMLSGRYDLPLEQLRANKVKNCNRYALLSGDLEEITRLRADKDFRFSFLESILYLACRAEPTRWIAKQLFILRYEINKSAYV